MPHMSVEVPHPLPQAEATARLKTFLERVRAQYQDQVNNLRGEWTEHRLDFSFDAYGFHIAGNLISADRLARVEGELPAAAMLFQGRIEQTIRDQLLQALQG